MTTFVRPSEFQESAAGFPSDRREALLNYTEEQCIGFLKEKGIELPAEDAEFWSSFFFKQFSAVLSNPAYHPVYSAKASTLYSLLIRDAVLTEIGNPREDAELESHYAALIDQLSAAEKKSSE